MNRLNPRLADLLESKGIPYRSVPHSADMTSQMTASHIHTPGREFAKSVVIRVDGQFAMAVLPAHLRVDFEKLRKWLNAQEVRLATEEEMGRLFPDCEIGAEPPFGNLYELPVYVSPLLSRERITFNGGSHEEAVEIRYDDYVALAKPSVIDFVSV